MLFQEAFSIGFFVFFALAAITDIIDGPIARKLNVSSKIGAILDSIADIFFALCIIVVVFPVIELTLLSYLLVGGVFFCKIISIIFTYVRFKEIISYHTTLIRVAAWFVFSFPIWVMFFNENIVVLVLSILMYVVYTEEFLITGLSKEKPSANIKSVFHKL